MYNFQRVKTLKHRDGHIADSENSENYKCLGHFFDRKELSDGAGNSANRKISKRRISAVYTFFSQLLLEHFLWPIKVDHFMKKLCLWNTKINEIHNFLFRSRRPSDHWPQVDVRFVHAYATRWALLDIPFLFINIMFDNKEECDV